MFIDTVNKTKNGFLTFWAFSPNNKKQSKPKVYKTKYVEIPKGWVKVKEDDKIMFIKFDDSPVDGVFSTDGYIDARHCTEKQIAKYILERIKLNK